MRVRTDDELYRVDAVWLGPPRWTFPFRVRYVAWGVGFAAFLLVFAVVRKVFGAELGFFSLAWSVVITVAITRWICSKITHERRLSGVFALWLAELRAPRARGQHRTSAASAARVTVREHRPRPRDTSHRRRTRRTHA